MGLAGHYSRFVEHFSLISSPLTQLTQKGVKFEFDEQCELNFQELKNRLIIALVLTLLTTEARYVMFSDAFR